MPKRTFRKRIYTAAEFARDAWGVGRSGAVLAGVYGARTLSTEQRERVWLAVSGVNACRYCLFVHGAWARSAGLSAREIDDLTHARPDPDARADEAAVTYVQALAERDFRGVPAELVTWYQETYPAAVRARIEAVARMANLSNRTGNTFDALLSRLGGAAAPGSQVVDELVVSAAFLAAAAVITPAMAVLRRRSPLGMLLELRRISRGIGFEAPT